MASGSPPVCWTQRPGTTSRPILSNSFVSGDSTTETVSYELLKSFCCCCFFPSSEQLLDTFGQLGWWRWSAQISLVFCYTHGVANARAPRSHIHTGCGKSCNKETGFGRIWVGMTAEDLTVFVESPQITPSIHTGMECFRFVGIVSLQLIDSLTFRLLYSRIET